MPARKEFHFKKEAFVLVNELILTTSLKRFTHVVSLQFWSETLQFLTSSLHYISSAEAVI